MNGLAKTLFIINFLIITSIPSYALNRYVVSASKIKGISTNGIDYQVTFETMYNPDNCKSSESYVLSYKSTAARREAMVMMLTAAKTYGKPVVISLYECSPAGLPKIHNIWIDVDDWELPDVYDYLGPW